MAKQTAPSTTAATPLEKNNALQIEIVKHVTMPTLKLELDKQYFVTFKAPIYKAKALGRERASKDGKKMEPPELAHVLNLQNNTEATIIVNTVLGTELRESYPNDGYVGKSFRIIKSKLESKQYATFDIAEVRIKK